MEHERGEKKATKKVQGVVQELLPNVTFRVRLDNGEVIIAHLSGKMKMNYIRVLAGDTVLLEMSEYDTDRARIVRRL
jgi:translation initiation factor IF-1